MKLCSHIVPERLRITKKRQRYYISGSIFELRTSYKLYEPEIWRVYPWCSVGN